MNLNLSGKKLKTPLRYPGGKSRAIKHIKDFFPREFSEYREPFIGGGSVFLYVRSTYPDTQCWINDSYYNLFCFWVALRDEPDALLREILSVRNANPTPDHMRDVFEQCKNTISSCDELDRAAKFFILNKCSYSGLTEIGRFSPQASVQNFSIGAIGKLPIVSEALQGVKITNEDYEVVVNEPGDNVFIYLDPPYDILKKGKNNALYGAGGNLHKAFDHDRFMNVTNSAAHKWLITYNSSDELKQRFSRHHIYEWELKYSMKWGSDNKAKKKKELIITNYEV